MTSVEEWRLVARAMAAHDVVIQVDAEVSEYWADHMFGARAKQFIAAFDAVMEFRGPPRYETGVEQNAAEAELNKLADAVIRDTQASEIERVARRMARSDARDNHIPADRIDAEVDKYWHMYEADAAEHLNQLRSGNA